MRGSTWSWILALGAAVFATGSDIFARAAHVSHLVPSFLGAILFVGAGFASGISSEHAALRAAAPLATSTLMYALLTGGWIVQRMGFEAGASVAAIAGGMNLLIGGVSAFWGFSSGKRTRIRRGGGPSEPDGRS